MKLKLRTILIALIGIILVSVLTVRGCRKPEAKGRILYEQHCQSCHGEKGEGFFGYPPVADADFVKQNQSDIACIIYYGMEGEIVVNNETYDQRMIGNPELSATQIANISNYVYNTLNNADVHFTEDMIIDQLENCSGKIVK